MCASHWLDVAIGLQPIGLLILDPTHMDLAASSFKFQALKMLLAIIGEFEYIIVK
jgi:hypothetical protein